MTITALTVCLLLGAILGRSEQLDRRERRRWTAKLSRRDDV